ncbi:Lrp/AsnC family transcriptional regulator [Mameliella sediminis]|uniref:Lrp/AsnC family transcriptional regulator n=1 Tax=Mameliella sediminis TaxID=2836866 RepID=UPI001C45E740|nr:Lrp/AsnC family transcriptional regulator [Mameliella sediminis]MBV7393902.1 Lrp/AsnC family transcriptional regulator [Mameliella sediminis]MBY6162185.1 Lrp/AsnC family transcriptional regulator [Mameliella alba]MBY6170655.1 Lrp/AsnC family transcriptional regulator [Mameliella alba]MBY6175673.1 Lrp/AsnC family transcriptional regulator [Mameliella alba]
MSEQIDETDRALIAALAENARVPVADLARRLGLARTTVQARIDRLETRGAIAGYTLKRGPGLRPALRATVLISVEPRATAAVLSRLKLLTAVETVHTTSGRFDLIAQVTADTTEALDRTLDAIGEAKGVKGSESLIHLSTKIDRAG